MQNNQYIYLNYDQIVHINERVIRETGGNIQNCGVVINRNSLDYIIESVCSSIVDKDILPTIYHKAAQYAHKIICDHVFRMVIKGLVYSQHFFF